MPLPAPAARRQPPGMRPRSPRRSAGATLRARGADYVGVPSFHSHKTCPATALLGAQGGEGAGEVLDGRVVVAEEEPSTAAAASLPVSYGRARNCSHSRS